MPERTTQQDLEDAYAELYGELNNAYWAATTIEAKDRIRGLADVVSSILDKLRIEEIRSRTAEFRELSEKARDLNGRLEDLKKKIDDIIHSIKVATNVTKAVDKAIGAASRFFH